MHTGRTAGLTGASADDVLGICQQSIGAYKCLPIQSDPSGNTIVDKYACALQLRVIGRRQAAEIIAIRHYQKREDTDGSMLNGMNTPHEIMLPGLGSLINFLRYFKPQPFGFKNLRWQIERNFFNQFLAVDAPDFIFGDMIGHFYPAAAGHRAPYRLLLIDFQNFRFLISSNLSEIINIPPRSRY